MKRQTGITLIELLAALAVIGVLAAIALPGWEHATTRARLVATQSHLYESLVGASRHAIITGNTVTICPSSTGTACEDGNWGAGWIVFSDFDHNRDRSRDEPVIQHHSPTQIKVSASSGRQRVVFQRNGTSPGSNATFTLCGVSRHSPARAVILANSGRVRQEPASPQATASCRSQ